MIPRSYIPCDKYFLHGNVRILIVDGCIKQVELDGLHLDAVYFVVDLAECGAIAVIARYKLKVTECAFMQLSTGTGSFEFDGEFEFETGLRLVEDSGVCSGDFMRIVVGECGGGEGESAFGDVVTGIVFCRVGGVLVGDGDVVLPRLKHGVVHFAPFGVSSAWACRFYVGSQSDFELFGSGCLVGDGEGAPVVDVQECEDDGPLAFGDKEGDGDGVHAVCRAGAFDGVFLEEVAFKGGVPCVVLFVVCRRRADRRFVVVAHIKILLI